jgi:nucleotide-binding universal stress UspA family protein
MPNRIVLATDGSDGAAAAAQFLASLPLASGTEVQVVCVVDPFIESLLESVKSGAKHRARHLVRSAEEAVKRTGVKVSGALRTGDADHQILLAAQEFQADLIVLGSRSLGGLEGLLLGSVARNVAKHATCPVLIGRTPQYGLTAAVVGTDGSANGAGAVRFAAEFPLPKGTCIHVVHVLRPRNPVLDLIAIGEDALYQRLCEAEREERTWGEKLVKADGCWLESQGRQALTELRAGDPSSEILASVNERKADLLIVGTRGTSLIQGLLTGSVADRLLAHAACSVLLVR